MANSHAGRGAHRHSVGRGVDLRIEPLEDRRMLASGDLDTTFDLDGILISNLGFTEEALAVAVQTDGKIVVAGTLKFTASDFTRVFAAARFNVNGTLDTSFGNETTGDLDLVPGLATIDFDAFRDTLPSFRADGRDLLIDSAGRIVIAGTVEVSLDAGFGLARLNANGTLDTSFGVGGKVSSASAPTSTSEDAWAVGIQSDGTLVVGGRRSGTAQDFVLARYNGSTGAMLGSLITTDFAGGADWANDLAIQADDKIVLVGAATPIGLQRQFGVARYNSDGTLDTSFDGDGKRFVDITTAPAIADEAFAVAIDGTKIVMTGATEFAGGNTSFVALGALAFRRFVGCDIQRHRHFGVRHGSRHPGL